MSGTKRFYNKIKNNGFGVFHPYAFMCINGCKKCNPNKNSYRNKKTNNKFRQIQNSIYISA